LPFLLQIGDFQEGAELVAQDRLAQPHVRGLGDPKPLSWYSRHFHSPSQERQFISSVSFGVTFALTRTITHAIRDHRGPFRNLQVGGRHIHHLTFGIGGLLGVGYAWLNGVGMPNGQVQTRSSRVTAGLYGAGSALTLDEFALWLNLEDDYWTKQGRESIDAVVMFGALLSAGASARHHIADLIHRARHTRPNPTGREKT
jgi:hypothetical protein